MNAGQERRMAGHGSGLRRAASSLASAYNRWVIERSRRAVEQTDPLSVFDRDPDDGPENEGLMHYGTRR
jgi:hypothetical protein